VIDPAIKKRGRGWKCPHCEHAMAIRTSKTIHPLMRRYFLQCQRVECGASFVVSSEIERQLSPSGTPDAEVEAVMKELNHRYQRRKIGKPEDETEAEKPREEPPRFHGVDHAPKTQPGSTLSPGKLNR